MEGVLEQGEGTRNSNELLPCLRINLLIQPSMKVMSNKIYKRRCPGSGAQSAHLKFCVTFLGKMFTLKQIFRRDLATNFLGKNARVHVIIVLVNGKSDLKTKQISNNRTRWSCQQ